MKINFFIPVIFLLLVACAEIGNKASRHAGNTAENLPYTDTSLPIDARVDDLVSRMDIAEKISQMYNEAPAIERLGVPAYDWWNEALHGVARAGKATVFPQAIGMAAAFDETLMLKIATAISDEGRAKHHYFFSHGVTARYTGLTFWSPNINIFRDPRWGRGQETYGEDPFLTGRLAINFINGLQGDDDKYMKSAATAKHFAVHSGPEKTRHSDNYHATKKDMRETYLPAFEMAVKDADVETVMCAYNRVNDAPACGSDELLKDILRDEYQFKGHVVSDCGAIADFYDPSAHNLVRAPAEAAAWAVRAGTDLNCGTGRLSTFANLHFALQRKMITEEEIDTAVKRLFRTRFKLGMFDPEEMVPYASIPMSVVGSQDHLDLTQEAAEKSLVLLKNNGVLPLRPGAKVAVIGPNADNIDVLLGNYNGEPIQPVTPLKGIIKYAGEENIFYAPGSPLIADIYGHYEIVGEEHFFHQDDKGKIQPGLIGAYYNSSAENGFAAEPQLVRIDKNIDFYWRNSPLDQSVQDNFGVVWKGLLVPQETGEYQFQAREKLLLDGEEVKGSVKLTAGQRYTFEASRNFVWPTGESAVEPSAQVRWVNRSAKFVAEAVNAADQADVVVFMGGISPRLEGEEMKVELEGFDYGDRISIDLPFEQRDLLRRLEAAGKPVVLVNFSGSAMALNWENQNLDAIIQAFYPGEATGTALARLLWGEYSPSGRLPVTFYKGVDDLPGFTDYTMENRTYKYYRGDVLYPFGYGLSYTKFTYSDLTAPVELESADSLVVSATLENAGDMAGDEIVQLYVSLLEAPVDVPIRELKGFKRVSLAAGEKLPVAFELNRDDFFYIDEEGRKQPYTGRMLVTLGAGQKGHVAIDGLVEQVITVE